MQVSFSFSLSKLTSSISFFLADSDPFDLKLKKKQRSQDLMFSLILDLLSSVQLAEVLKIFQSLFLILATLESEIYLEVV